MVGEGRPPADTEAVKHDRPAARCAPLPPVVCRLCPRDKVVVARPFLDDTWVYYGNRTKTIRKTQCHPETPNRLLPDFPQRCPPAVGRSPPPTPIGQMNCN